jgi:hypothetical protein
MIFAIDCVTTVTTIGVQLFQAALKLDVDFVVVASLPQKEMKMSSTLATSYFQLL